MKISFRDNGRGIKKENLKKVFDPFFTTKLHSKEHGTGLGLNLSLQIIETHGGEIEIHSKWNSYTKVDIILPIKKIN